MRKGLHKTIRERIQNSIVINDTGCWLWKRHLVHNGYGTFRYSDTRKRVVAHRASYIEYVGEIPEGKQLDHLCKVRHCVNPKHLEPVTPKENTMRSDSLSKLNAVKTHCKYGHPFSGHNLQIVWNGARRCRECGNKQAREYQRGRSKVNASQS